MFVGKKKQKKTEKKVNSRKKLDGFLSFFVCPNKTGGLAMDGYIWEEKEDSENI